MKIISIIRDNKITVDVPNEFTVGASPVINNDEVGPAVSKIVFFETGYAKGQAFRGPCYVVSFEDSNVKRVIPANDNILEVAVELETSKKKDVPELPVKGDN
jgi:hypothetical protein